MESGQGGAALGLAHVQARDPIRAEARATTVIDTDFHVVPAIESLRPYMEEPFRSKVRRYPVVGTEYQPNFATDAEDASQAAQGVARSAADILRVLDEIGVDTVVVTPGFARPAAIFQPSVLGAVASAYNDWLAAEVLPVSPRIKALIMVDQRTPERAGAEIRRVAANPGFVGVYTEFGAYEPLGSARHDPLFDALAETGLPVTTHGSGFWPQFSGTSLGSRTWTELMGVSWPCYAMVFVASLIMQGVFDKYPELRVLVQEGGVWWIPEMALRLDDIYLGYPHDVQLVERKLELGERYLRRLPSEYLAEHIWLSTQPMTIPKDQRHFAWLLELCGAERRFCYSSDWPHGTFDPVNWLFENPAVTEPLRQRILTDNARELFQRL